jgi:Protein of unknown function (DUF3072)
MTGPQESHLRTPSREARAEVPADLNKAEASKKIDELQAETGRSNVGEGIGQPASADLYPMCG